jgi:hypothetical protein
MLLIDVVPDIFIKWVFRIVPVLCLLAALVFVVDHRDDECVPLTPRTALAHQACIDAHNEKQGETQ